MGGRKFLWMWYKEHWRILLFPSEKGGNDVAPLGWEPLDPQTLPWSCAGLVQWGGSSGGAGMQEGKVMDKERAPW